MVTIVVGQTKKTTPQTKSSTPSWKHGPDRDTAVQPTPEPSKPIVIEEERKAPQPVFPPEYYSMTPLEKGRYEKEHGITHVRHRGVDYSSYWQIIQPGEQRTVQTPTAGGRVPLSVKEGVTPPTVNPDVSPQYQQAVTKVRYYTPPGKTVSKSTYVKDLITGATINRPYWTDQEREYYRFTQSGPVQKFITHVGAAVHNPIDFMGEAPKFIYSSMTSDREQARKGFFENFIYKEVARAKQVTTPLDVPGYMFESPAVSIPAFAGAMGGLGYMRTAFGSSSAVAKFSTGVQRAMGVYFGREAVKGGVEAYEQGELPSYLYKTGLYAVGISAVGGTFYKQGEVAGFAKYRTARLKTVYDLAKSRFYQEQLMNAKQLSSKSPAVFDVKNVLGESQGVRFQNAMLDLKGQGIKPGLAGSSALSTYVKDMSIIPKDIDIHIPMVLRVRSPIGEGMKLQSPVARVSNVPKVEAVFRSYGIDMSKLDIHDMMQPGTEFNTRGIGFTQDFVKTAKGSVFEQQMSFSELTTRNIKEAMVPEHTLRGKDFIRVADVAAQEFDTVMEMKPSSYAKMLEQKGLVDVFPLKIGKPSPRLGHLVEDPDALGVMIHSIDKSIMVKPELGVKQFILPKMKQETYAHELLHLEPYLQTGVPGSEGYAYGLESTVKFYKPLTSVELWKHQPELKPGTYEMIGPSYYDTHPMEAPKSQFTFFEKIIRKYSQPLTTKDLYREPPDFTKPTVKAADQFRPQLIKGQPEIPSWAKGVKFFSSMAALSVKPWKYDYMLSLFGAGKRSTYPSTTSTKKYTEGIPYTSYTPYTEKSRYQPTVDDNYQKMLSSVDYTPPVPSYKPSQYIPYQPSALPAISYPPYRQEYETGLPPPPTTKTFTESDITGVRKQKQEQPGYDVYVKERSYVRGKKRYPEAWKKANTTPLNERTAMSLGATAVDQSAAASFKIRPAAGHAGSLKIPVNAWDALSGKFYQRKGVYIEQTAHRIDSPGEIRGISALGWIANQNRTMKAMQPARIRSPAVNGQRMVRTQYEVNMNKILRGVGL